MFWFIAIFLTLLVAAAILWPLTRQGASAPARADHDVEVYGAQLRELEGDLRRGIIRTEEAASAKAEIGRRLLRAAAETDRAAIDEPCGRRGLVAAGVFASAVLLVGSTAFYLAVGQPGEPDRPLAARLSVDPSKADMPTLVAQAEARLRENPDDGRGWETLLPIYMRMGRPQDAVTAANNVIRLLGPTAEREAMRGEAETQAASGEVTDAAKISFETALRLDPSNPVARFFLALDLSQEGRFAEAAPAWRQIIDRGPADAPWIMPSRMALADAERRSAPAAPAASTPPVAGPSPEQVAAAAELPAGDRTAMVQGMVSRLADRLKSAPNDPDGWKRLMRSYAVLGDLTQARQAYRQAQSIFAEGSPDRASIDEFAGSLGLGDSKAM